MYIPFVAGKYIFKYIIIYLFISMNKIKIAHGLSDVIYLLNIPLIVEKTLP